MNRSARRMAMPEVSEDLFVGGIKELIGLDRDWVPTGEDTSLYIRPFLLATDEFIGVRPAERFMFIIITSPGLIIAIPYLFMCRTSMFGHFPEA